MAYNDTNQWSTPKKTPVIQKFLTFMNRQSAAESRIGGKVFRRSGSDHAIQVHSTQIHNVNYYPMTRKMQVEPQVRGTPPLVAFSSDEDISKAPCTPQEPVRPFKIEIIAEPATSQCKSAPTTPSLQIKHSTQLTPSASKPQTPERIFKFLFKRNKNNEASSAEPKSPSKSEDNFKLGRRLFRSSSQKHTRTSSIKYKSRKHNSNELPIDALPENVSDSKLEVKAKEVKRPHTVQASGLIPCRESAPNFMMYNCKIDTGIQCDYLESRCVSPGVISPLSPSDSGASLQSNTPQTSPSDHTYLLQHKSLQVSPIRHPLSSFSQHYSWPTDNETTPRRSETNAGCPRFVDIGSTDSGIQPDTTLSSLESFKGINRYVDSTGPTLPVRRRRYGTVQNTYSIDRPSSACSTYDNVMWPEQFNNPAVINQQQQTTVSPTHPMSDYRYHTRSDLGGNKVLQEAIQKHQQLMNVEVDSLSALTDCRSKASSAAEKKLNRRLSTPHSIKPRTEKAPPVKRNNPQQQTLLKRCNSAPDVTTQPIRRDARTLSSNQVSDVGEEQHSLTAPRVNHLIAGSTECLHNSFSYNITDDQSICSSEKAESFFGRDDATYAEALWDHVTMDDEELAFRAGDQILVLDVTDRDWWWGMMGQNEGWFPAAFVRLKANQEDTAEDFAMRIKEGQMDKQTALQRYSVNLLSRDQARTNVVNEIIQAEREYVRHLRDVVEGYLEKARRRPEMFSEERIYRIFGNLEEIYAFSQFFLQDLEKHFRSSTPQLSELGQCFIRFSKGFEIYSDYCNSHPLACEELDSLQLQPKYQHFFEACRLLQDMIEIPLEGFLLIPVQKICKYPLQLAELLKYTNSNHPDHQALNAALDTMKNIALLINERKRKMESIEKLAAWQHSVQQWPEGNDLVEMSSELIHQGELMKVNSSGWHQERTFFLFDHQLVYCKKDLLWRDLLVYKGRLDLNHCDIHPIPDGKDSTFNATIKNGWKVFDHKKEKWYLLYSKTAEDKDKWLSAFKKEREKVAKDKECGFRLPQYVRNSAIAHAKSKLQDDKSFKNKRSRKISRVPVDYQHPALKKLPSHSQLHTPAKSAYRTNNDESKKHWFATLGKKFKK